ncbi:MAG: hypothetical protein V3V20_00465 [Algisphaera sp.]
MFNLLLAQQQQPEIPAEAIAALFAIAAVVLVVFLLIGLLVAWLIYKPYSKLPKEYHTLAPGLCFLLLVPFAGLVMPIILGIKIPEAFAAYFADRGDTSVGDAGKGIGLWWGISVLCCMVPILNIFAAIAALVLLIIFILKLWEMAKRIDTQDEGMASPNQMF